jgi:hypothetical protein
LSVRVDLAPLWFALAAATSVGLALWQQHLLGSGRVDSPRPELAVVAAALLAVTLPAVLPTTAWSFSLQENSVTTALSNAESARRRALAGEQIRQRIGADTVVTYLSFGDANYYVRNPTACPYPTNVFLQRSRYFDKHEDTASWIDNLRCLDDQRPAWLIIDTSWFTLKRMPPEIRNRVNASFDCQRAFKAAKWTVCPRRTPT